MSAATNEDTKEGMIGIGHGGGMIGDENEY